MHQSRRIDDNAHDLHDVRVLRAREAEPQAHRHVRQEGQEVAVDELCCDVLHYELLHHLAMQQRAQ